MALGLALLFIISCPVGANISRVSAFQDRRRVVSEPTYRVDISTAAVVLGEVASEALVHICTAQHQHEPAPAARGHLFKTR